MALRGGSNRKIPGNPLGGVLRELDRKTRSTSRGPAGRPGPAGEQGPPGAPGLPALGAVAVADADGVAWWMFPVGFERSPVVVATVECNTVDLLPVATVETVSRSAVAVRVRWSNGGPGAGVRVHMMAVPAPAGPEPEELV